MTPQILRLSGLSFLDNTIALDYLLTEQGGIDAVANTTCYTWFNISGQGKAVS